MTFDQLPIGTVFIGEDHTARRFPYMVKISDYKCRRFSDGDLITFDRYEDITQYGWNPRLLRYPFKTYQKLIK